MNRARGSHSARGDDVVDAQRDRVAVRLERLAERLRLPDRRADDVIVLIAGEADAAPCVPREAVRSERGGPFVVTGAGRASRPGLVCGRDDARQLAK